MEYWSDRAGRDGYIMYIEWFDIIISADVEILRKFTTPSRTKRIPKPKRFADSPAVQLKQKATGLKKDTKKTVII